LKSLVITKNENALYSMLHISTDRIMMSCFYFSTSVSAYHTLFSIQHLAPLLMH